MIITGVYAWLLYHAGIPLDPLPPEQNVAQLSAPIQKSQIDAFFASSFFERFEPYAELFIPTDAQKSLVVCSTKKAKRRLKNVEARQVATEKTHVCATKTSPHFYVVAPKTYLEQRATMLSPASIVLLANAMANKLPRFPFQAFDPYAQATSSGALINPQDISFASRNQKIANYVLTGLESIGECKLATLLFTPALWGGANLPPAKANAVVRLTKLQRQILGGKSSIRIDFYWPEARVGIEYDSKQYHSDFESVSADKRRFLATADKGITLLPVTKSVLCSTKSRLAFLRSLATHLHTHLPESESWHTRHQALFSEIWYRSLVF